MTATTSKVPTHTRSSVQDPFLNAWLEERLAPYSGKKLENAQQAVLAVIAANKSGVWAEITGRLDAAIAAVADRDRDKGA